jgi:hypothetical protein
MLTIHCSLLSLGCVFAAATPSAQVSMTAFRAFKISQRRLKLEVRAKLLSVSSARTDATLVPQAWRFVFHDPSTSRNCRIVTVAAKASSEHPDTVEAFRFSQAENVAVLHPVPQNKLLVDSDQALERARAAAKLKGVMAIEYRLVYKRNGREPLWNLQFYAEGGKALSRVQIGAKTGKIELPGIEAKAPRSEACLAGARGVP